MPCKCVCGGCDCLQFKFTRQSMGNTNEAAIEAVDWQSGDAVLAAQAVSITHVNAGGVNIEVLL